MAISVKTHKMLWGRAASRCALCKNELVMDASETDDESVVGEACHIVAASVDGPRGESDLTSEQRDKYANLILLCNVHHKQIDDQYNTFPVDRLTVLKAEHEAWVKSQLGFDAVQQRDDEFYAGVIDEWASRIDLDHWQNRASPILCHGQPSIDRELLKALEDVRAWLLSRHWPGRYPAIESAFTNFRHVVQDFCMTFNQHAVPRWETSLQTEKFYKIPRWDPELYRQLSGQFHYHVALVSDLMLEVTRSINYLFSMIRRDLIPSYRSNEGLVLIENGPLMDLSYVTYRVEYSGAERVEKPYPGLEQFKIDRQRRDVHFGAESEVG